MKEPNKRKSERRCWKCSQFFTIQKGEIAERYCPSCLAARHRAHDEAVREGGRAS